jgi:hypothetical protein
VGTEFVIHNHCMAPARIDGIVAAEANVAIVFRRGPSKLTQLLVWDLNTDEVTPGQWIKGHAYTRRADVSPDGRYLVCAFTNYSASRKRHTKLSKDDEWLTCGWTAVSRPPYFTAIGLWFTGGAWNGGGIWEDNRSLLLNNEPHTWTEVQPVMKPVRARRLNLGGSEDEPIYSMLLRKRGWSEEQPLELQATNPGWRERAAKFAEIFKSEGFGMASAELLMDSVPRYRTVRAGIWRKPFERGSLCRIDRHLVEEWSICDASDKPRKTWMPRTWQPQFLDLDGRGRIIFGDQGCLWAWEGFPDGKPRMIADLSPNSFTPIAPPPWAIEW